LLRDTIYEALEAKKRKTSSGVEYWMARDIQAILGYSRWENFVSAINRAQMACESTGLEPSHQFRETTKGIVAGKGAEVQRADYFLTRYACYLVCMNGDTAKPEVGLAQAYFAVQTRRQEVQDHLASAEQRLEARQRVRDANRGLSSAAKRAGVRNYGRFHDAGYRGLYGGLAKNDIEQLKSIPSNEDLLDCICRAELAANEFRATQTEQKLIREQIQGEYQATDTHFEVGAAVRRTIKTLGGTMPEDLPAQPSIRKLVTKKQERSSRKTLRLKA
jgi:DNA-damage-inducible protein D